MTISHFFSPYKSNAPFGISLLSLAALSSYFISTLHKCYDELEDLMAKNNCTIGDPSKIPAGEIEYTCRTLYNDFLCKQPVDICDTGTPFENKIMALTIGMGVAIAIMTVISLGAICNNSCKLKSSATEGRTGETAGETIPLLEISSRP